jgi:type IV secretion system protein VirB9
MKKLLFTLLIGLNTSFSSALDYPTHSTKDGRIQYVNYAPNDVVLVRAAVGVATQIILEPDEQVLEMASGFSDGWEIVDKRNNIYLKPKKEKANTNLVVTTNKRAYAFDLKANTTKHPTYRLAFHYPDTLHKLSNEQINSALVENNFSQAELVSVKNQNYTMQPNKFAVDILPIKAFDNGRFTYIKFAKNSEMPSVYKVGRDKQETIVNTHVQDDYLVIHGIYQTLALRAGNAVVGLYNESYNGGSSDITRTGTVSNNVYRETQE